MKQGTIDTKASLIETLRKDLNFKRYLNPNFSKNRQYFINCFELTNHFNFKPSFYI